MDIKTAILIDGSFFLQRLSFHYRKYYPSQPPLTAPQTIEILRKVVSKHLSSNP